MLFQLLKKTPSISTEELQSHLSKRMTLLDVRTSSEYCIGHIPQAVNVPLNKVPAYNKSTNEVYAICQSDMRSKNTAETLAKRNCHAINVRGEMSQRSGQIKGGK